LKEFASGYRARIAQGQRFDEDLQVRTKDGQHNTVVFRLRHNVECLFEVEGLGKPQSCNVAASRIPLLIERQGHHKKEGGNVLYLDGHVEFLRYPGKWPMTPETMSVIDSLEALGK